MKLYYSKGACSLVVRIVINELDLKCEYEAVDLKTKKTETGSDYLKINPKGAVPALEIKPNEVLTENSVIQQYLVDTHICRHMLEPIPDFMRYRTLEMLNFVSTDIHKSFSPLFNPNIPVEVKENIFIPTIKSKFSYVNSKLVDRKYIMGDDFSLPDAYLFVMLRWARSMKIDLSANDHLMRYFDFLQQRPSIIKSLQEEGL